MVQIAILLPSSAFIGWLIGAWLDSRLHQVVDCARRNSFRGIRRFGICDPSCRSLRRSWEIEFLTYTADRPSEFKI